MASMNDIKKIFDNSIFYKKTKLLLDIWGIFYTKKNIDIKYLKKIIAKADYIHLKDLNFISDKFVTIGGRDIPFLKLLNNFKNKTYNKCFVFETHKTKS